MHLECIIMQLQSLQMQFKIVTYFVNIDPTLVVCLISYQIAINATSHSNEFKPNFLSIRTLHKNSLSFDPVKLDMQI